MLRWYPTLPIWGSTFGKVFEDARAKAEAAKHEHHWRLDYVVYDTPSGGTPISAGYSCPCGSSKLVEQGTDA